MKDHTLNVKSLVMMLGASSIAMGLTTHVIAQDFTWFVDDNAPGGIGDQWDTAFNNLQDALDEADESIGSDLIKVARGKYFPTNEFPPGDPRNATFAIIQGVTIEGGYAGVTAEPGHEDDRDVDLYETILSGDIGIPQQTFDNSYQVVLCGGEFPSPEVNGFTISDGNANVIVGPFGGYIGGGMLIVNSDPVVVQCTFTNNYAGRGGGIFVIGNVNPVFVAEPFIVNCKMSENSAAAGGGMAISVMADVTLVNSIITNNSAQGLGGAIYNDAGGIITLINSTLSDNSAELDGGGLTVLTPSQASLENCIVWGNTPNQILTDGDIVAVNFSDVQGGWAGTANINDDPMFIPGRGFYQLMKGSPCIDAANNTAVPADIADLDGDENTTEQTPFDLDLNSRFIDNPTTPDCQQAPGQCGDPPVVDMGAYEFVFVDGCPWDLDGDCAVGVLDLLALLAAWGPNPGHQADFNGDGEVSILDLLILLANWGPCPEPCPPPGSPPPSLEDVLGNAGLSINDWDLLLDTLQNGTQEEKDNALCWFGYYINGCDGGPRQACSDHDPFTDCVGDLNGDCCVDKLDADILLNQMGSCPAGPGACLGDLNGDCVVDKSDHRDLLGHFGACPGTQYCPTAPPGCGTTTTTQLDGAVTLMGFSGVADYQGHISATTEGEAFVCACVLQVLLEAQP